MNELQGIQAVHGVDGPVGDWVKSHKRPLLIALGVGAIGLGAVLYLRSRQQKAELATVPRHRTLGGVSSRSRHGKGLKRRSAIRKVRLQ